MLIARLFSVALSVSVYAQDIQPESGEFIDEGKDDSPYVDRNFAENVYRGDTHPHTSYSTDAGMIGNTLGPDAAYRFATGLTYRSNLLRLPYFP